jgi:hypothetical protein
MKKSQKPRKLRSTKGTDFPVERTVKVPSLRTEQACNSALVFLERHERRAFNRAMRALKPQMDHWARYIKHTHGPDSADMEVVNKFWANMVARYKANRRIEKMYESRIIFDPDVNGEKYG